MTVQIGKSIENGRQQGSGFGGRQGALRKNLREIFLSILRDQEEKSCAVEFTASHLKDMNEVRMRSLGGRTPTGKLLIVGNFCRYQLDGSFSSSEFGQEDGALIGASQPLPQGKFPRDHPSFPRFP